MLSHLPGAVVEILTRELHQPGVPEKYVCLAILSPN